MSVQHRCRNNSLRRHIIRRPAVGTAAAESNGGTKVVRPGDCSCSCFKEAVCIDAERIYDSCSDKDCLEDLQVFFSDKTQPIIDKAASIKCKKVKVLNVCVDVESVPFNKGFYSVDMTFYFLVELSVYLSPGTPAVNCCGISYFSKKVILYGSEANARVFSSHTGCCNGNEQLTAMPNAVVQIVDPICLACRYVECPEKTCCPGAVIPCQICTQVGGSFQDVPVSKEVYITLGLFTIVQLQRKVQMMVPAYDFCIPDKESEYSTGDPCEMFKKIQFPMEDFFPPRLDDFKGDCDCCNG